MTFADRIRAHRLALGLTQDDFAARLGVSGQTVSNWECGRSVPWPRTQVRVLGEAVPTPAVTPRRQRKSVSDLI